MLEKNIRKFSELIIMPDFSVIIVSFNTQDQILNCLASIFGQLNGVDGEIFVVDNNSTDGTPQTIKEKYPSLQLIANHENLGFAKANNLAIKRASGKYIILLNSDTILKSCFFDQVIQFMESRQDVGIAGCLLRNTDGSVQTSAYANYPGILTEIVGYSFLNVFLNRVSPFRKYPGKYALSPEEHQRAQEVAHVTGACMIIRKQVFDDVGLFDENFFMYREETDLCKRTSEKGWKIYLYPSVEVIHHHKQSSKKLSDRGVNYRMTSHYLYFQKHYGIILTGVSYGLAIFLSVFQVMILWLAKVLGLQKENERLYYFSLILQWHMRKLPVLCFGGEK